jgi:prefoldin subunit 5
MTELDPVSEALGKLTAEVQDLRAHVEKMQACLDDLKRMKHLGMGALALGVIIVGGAGASIKALWQWVSG